MKKFKSYMRDFGVATLAAVLLTLMYAVDANATDVTLEWSWPDVYCPQGTQTVGDPLPLTDILGAEVYISEATIVSNGQSCSDLTDTPPSGAIISTVSTPNTTLVVDLQCGKTYFFRMRVQALNMAWSNLSGETTKAVDCSRPNVPIVIRIT